MSSETLVTVLTWTAVVLIPALTGYVVRKVPSLPLRTILFALILVAPILLLTIGLMLAPASPLGFIAWWGAGMVMITPAMIVWAVLASFGFIAGEGKAR